MPLVQGTVADPSLTVFGDVAVTISLVAGAPVGLYTLGSEELVASRTVMVDSTGAWSINLPGNVNITPAGSYYQATYARAGRTVGGPISFVVPASGGPYWVGTLAVNPSPPAGLLPSMELAYAQTTIGASSSDSSANGVLWPGLTVQVTVGNRPVALLAWCSYASNNTGGKNAQLLIYDATAATPIANAILTSPTGGQGGSLSAWARVPAGAGARQYEVHIGVGVFGAGTATYLADTTGSNGPATLQAMQV